MDSPLLRKGLKLSHLRLMAALDQTGQIGLAAAQMGVAQPAASRLMAELERITATPLTARDGRGLRMTPAGQALATRATRILAEIGNAGAETQDTGAGLRGHVRLGAVTAPALDLVLPALRVARLSLPQVTVEVEVGTSDQLAAQVLAGRLDFSLSRLPEDATPGTLTLRPIATEPVALVARRGHFLTEPGPVDLTALMAQDWILPGPGSPLRRAVLDRLAALGLPAPRGQLSTPSFLLTLAVLQQTNAVAPLASAVARQFAEGPGAACAVIPAGLEITVAAFGLLTRANTPLSPAAARLAALVVPALAGPVLI